MTLDLTTAEPTQCCGTRRKHTVTHASNTVWTSSIPMNAAHDSRSNQTVFSEVDNASELDFQRTKCKSKMLRSKEMPGPGTWNVVLIGSFNVYVVGQYAAEAHLFGLRILHVCVHLVVQIFDSLGATTSTAVVAVVAVIAIVAVTALKKKDQKQSSNPLITSCASNSPAATASATTSSATTAALRVVAIVATDFSLRMARR